MNKATSIDQLNLGLQHTGYARRQKTASWQKVVEPYYYPRK